MVLLFIAIGSIKFDDLYSLVELTLNIDESRFSSWFENSIEINSSTIIFLQNLISKTKPLIKYYKEEDLKIHFLGHLFGRVDFTSYKIGFRDLYNEKLIYKTESFTFCYHKIHKSIKNKIICFVY
jgi:hypothetical protein